MSGQQAGAAAALGQQGQAWNYAPPQAGVTAPYNPSAQSAFDLKSPLSKFALGMAMQNMQPGKNSPMPQQHVMGLQMPQSGVRNPYGALS